MLQILQTRILSVVAWYHLAFFAISMAMFGLTVGAVYVYLRGERFTEGTLSYDLAYFSTLFALSTFVMLGVQVTLAPVVTWSLAAVWTWLQLSVCMAVPFVFAGIVVSLALTRSPFPVGRVYAIDLFGAATGCLGALTLLNLTDGPSCVIWVGALAAAGAIAFSASSIGREPQPRPRWHSLIARRRAILLVLVALALANGASSYGLQPLVAKGKFEGGNSYIYRAWNTFSRITVTPTYVGPPHLWGPSPKIDDTNFVATQRDMNIDGDAGTTATYFDGRLADVGFLKYDVTNLAYFLPGRERAAIIGVGGGRDILSAALFGYRDITGVELNPVFVRLLTRQRGFADFTNVDRLPGVQFFIDEGRSWFARTPQHFDLIQMSLIDTWAATGAGAFSLSENGLYTTQAWRIFLDRLSDKGVFTVSRWFNPRDPSETARMLSLAVAALLAQRVAAPRQHIVLATEQNIATLLVSREPFSASDIAVLEGVAKQYDHHLLVVPGEVSASPILERIVSTRDRTVLDHDLSDGAFDLSPPTDDRPFFFNQVRLDRPLQALRIAQSRIGSAARLGGVRDGNLVATATLLVLFLLSLMMVIATILVPLRHAVRDVGRPLAVGGTLYFLLIGLGFMLVEIALLQRTGVFLGHPVYSLSILLFTLVLSTGFGSLASDRLELRTRMRFTAWAAVTALCIMLLPLSFDSVLPDFEGSRLLARALVCVALIAPAGFLMGFAFPTGMRLISRVDRRPTPWFWGVNGAAGVLASIAAVALSIGFGITVTLRIGGCCYLLLIPTALILLAERPEAARA
ncbi:MAG TPA: hypothetical protein VMU67_07185 [Steroidobacteraceae bacterium]|nr:hypothetical protein [Steroidobacteraceae bacterium]